MATLLSKMKGYYVISDDSVKGRKGEGSLSNQVKKARAEWHRNMLAVPTGKVGIGQRPLSLGDFSRAVLPGFTARDTAAPPSGIRLKGAKFVLEATRASGALL